MINSWLFQRKWNSISFLANTLIFLKLIISFFQTDISWHLLVFDLVEKSLTSWKTNLVNIIFVYLASQTSWLIKKYIGVGFWLVGLFNQLKIPKQQQSMNAIFLTNATSSSKLASKKEWHYAHFQYDISKHQF
jgi:hypothetical protein